MKGFGLPIDYVLYDMSYANMVMYGAVLPSYDSQKEDRTGSKQEQEEVRVDDPKNRERVRQILDSFD